MFESQGQFKPHTKIAFALPSHLNYPGLTPNPLMQDLPWHYAAMHGVQFSQFGGGGGGGGQQSTCKPFKNELPLIMLFLCFPAHNHICYKSNQEVIRLKSALEIKNTTWEENAFAHHCSPVSCS